MEGPSLPLLEAARGQGLSVCWCSGLSENLSHQVRIWGDLWVNHACISETVLELGLGINFPSGKDWQSMEVPFSSFPQCRELGHSFGSLQMPQQMSPCFCRDMAFMGSVGSAVSWFLMKATTSITLINKDEPEMCERVLGSTF